MWLEEFPCPPACALATLSAGLCSGFYTMAIPAEMFDEQEPAREFQEEDRAVGGANKFSSGEEGEADQSVVFRTFLRITSANQKNSFSSSFRRRKLVFVGISQYRSVKNQFSVVLLGEARSNMRGCSTVILRVDKG